MALAAVIVIATLVAVIMWKYMVARGEPVSEWDAKSLEEQVGDA